MKNLENPFIMPPTKVTVNSFLMDEGFLEKRSIIVFADKSWLAKIVKTVSISTNIGFHTKKHLKRQAWDPQKIAQFPAFFVKRKFFNRHYLDVFPSMESCLAKSCKECLYFCFKSTFVVEAPQETWAGLLSLRCQPAASSCGGLLKKAIDIFLGPLESWCSESASSSWQSCIISTFKFMFLQFYPIQSSHKDLHQQLYWERSCKINCDVS